MIDLFKIKEDFSFMVKEAEPWTLTQFVMWLDLKLSEFKTKGYMVLDHNVKTKPKWLEEDTITSDIAPPPAPCRNCNSSSSTGHAGHAGRDVGQYYSDIHASQPVHQLNAASRIKDKAQQKSTDESENIRGEVGIIDLSHGEMQNRVNNNNFRQNSNQNSAISQSANLRQIPSQGYLKQKIQTASIQRQEKRARTEVIEIDGSSPTEKMFSSNRQEIGKTSTPIVRRAGQLLQKAKNRQALSTGTAIYTSTTTTLTPTFSSSFSSQSTRTASSNRNFALGAPPVSSFLAPPMSSSAFSVSPVTGSQSLDDIIAETVQAVSGQCRLSTEVPPSSQSFSPEPKLPDSSSVKRQTSFQDTTSSNPLSAPTVFPGLSISPNSFSQMVDGQAVPVALHANIDNISRDLSQVSAPSGSNATEVKMETDLNASISDSFSTDAATLQTSLLDTSTDSSLSFQDTSHTSHGPVEPGGVPRPGLIDTETAKAYQMVELVTGSGVYVYDKTISQAFKVGTERDTGTYSGEKMARYLLNVFWSRKDLVGATLSKAGRGKKILNQQIIEAILVFCTSYGRHSRPKVRKAVCDYICIATWRAKQKLLKNSKTYHEKQF
ncbi:uncharacterized protein LOC143063626 isoform X4 [Mytilus galloprovincialis]|uniref:uncharacterized protein LOC143063626 isoform X4 n=1 Tax=Mytilus galloprovincialis TaxID=29158 RepID=UPI003F7BB7BA